jgi:hypothetical protein
MVTWWCHIVLRCFLGMRAVVEDDMMLNFRSNTDNMIIGGI